MAPAPSEPHEAACEVAPAPSGAIPLEIGNLAKLRELYIGYYNNYEGRIPLETRNLSSLVRLDAANCELSSEIPPEIGKLKKLDTLFLQVNGLTGSLTVELGSLLKNLTLLNLFKNKLHGAIPEFIRDLPNLEVLQLWQNNFTKWVRTFLTAPAPSEPRRSGAALVARALPDRLVDAETMGEDENLLA
ncbi:hypothetical protein FH972_011608 [Carpinus fangiana]|uniref:Leucine-rich repeat-containing N-terminal plant-type domain-containing protein n=1 Tax=Carpinus fangiana TaxID=176857 RepID=A0A660KTY3_9ROSI|nr:hypothetical protein FH972_011608 [Carpinus fangiana]